MNYPIPTCGFPASSKIRCIWGAASPEGSFSFVSDIANFCVSNRRIANILKGTISDERSDEKQQEKKHRREVWEDGNNEKMQWSMCRRGEYNHLNTHNLQQKPSNMECTSASRPKQQIPTGIPSQQSLSMMTTLQSKLQSQFSRGEFLAPKERGRKRGRDEYQSESEFKNAYAYAYGEKEELRGKRCRIADYMDDYGLRVDNGVPAYPSPYIINDHEVDTDEDSNGDIDDDTDYDTDDYTIDDIDLEISRRAPRESFQILRPNSRVAKFHSLNPTGSLSLIQRKILHGDPKSTRGLQEDDDTLHELLLHPSVSQYGARINYPTRLYLFAFPFPFHFHSISISLPTYLQDEFPHTNTYKYIQIHIHTHIHAQRPIV